MGHYDCVIIGAGMSGLAAGIRLAMFGKKVCILEKHTIAGGLNSYYKRGKRNFDVGLHALTNYVAKGTRGAPLTKLFKQLRLSHESFALKEQSYSQIVFDKLSGQNQFTLQFNNTAALLTQEIAAKFPEDLQNFTQLLEELRNFDATSLDVQSASAKTWLAQRLTSPILREMLLCPLLIYGSAWENDMDLAQFAIMFQSIYLQGLARPMGGVRTIIDLLEKRFVELGGHLRYRAAVKQIHHNAGGVSHVELANGEEISCQKVLSSAGLPETLKMAHAPSMKAAIGRLGFTETILVLDKTAKNLGQEATLSFYNRGDHYQYRRPEGLFDPSSAVICFPGNFNACEYEEGIVRITHIANYEKWKDLDKDSYKREKQAIFNYDVEFIQKFLPNHNFKLLFHDVFTPMTVERYTWHLDGCVYGSPDKSRKGMTPIKGLHICGTDQGFLGIVGAMLSGISMANLHVLMGNSASNSNSKGIP